jgi:hypothetical protein
MTSNPDRLYQLVPVVYRLRDADQGYPLRALLQVLAEQVTLVEHDISQLYENWFIETCQDWVVPYIGSLLGYTPVTDTAEPSDLTTPRALARERLLIPRAEVGNTIRFRRRKGTLSLLEDLARAVGGWPAHAVEFYRLLGVTQNIDHLRLERGRTVNLRDGTALDLLGGPFDSLAHTVDVRRVSARRSRGTMNIPEAAVWIWRLQSYSVTESPAYCYEEESPNCYLFSVLGNDTQLFAKPQAVPSSLGYRVTELNYPVPLTRRALEALAGNNAARNAASSAALFYGDGKSFEIWTGSPRQALRPDQVVIADLSDWSYRPSPDTVAVDPALGRMVFPPGQARKQGVWVSYHYGFSGDLGGGEYARTLAEPPGAVIYLVGEGEVSGRLSEALARWQTDGPKDAVIEITDSGAYVEPISIALKAGQSLQIRAANGKRPVIRLLDWQTSQPDDLTVTGEAGSWFTLDGLLITGRGVQVEGALAGVVIRHTTLVPGWGLQCNCEPKRPAEPSLYLLDAPACLRIEHSIVGGIQVDCDETKYEPLALRITDSIVDATDLDGIALGAPESLCAHATLTIARSTVFGKVQTHAIELAENSIFMSPLLACRRQLGCVRFCYVPRGSRTPRRFECQPDLVVRAVVDSFQKGDIGAADRDALCESERLRVEPEFNGTRFGTPDYCQLADTCADEIKRGADDESELGVFHDLFQPQRAANLTTRLTEFTPAGMDVGIIFVN